MGSEEQGRLVGQAQAEAIIAGVTDPITRELLAAYLAVVWEQAGSGARPSKDFDLAFAVLIAKELFAKQELLRAILAGSDFGKWPE